MIDGGGGMLNGGTLTLKNSTVSGNSAAGGFGGGVANYFGTLTMTDSTVSGNSAARSGGGMLNRGGTVKLTNSTVSGNSAPGDGGGLLNNYGSTLALINSTVSGNTAGNRGGGVLNGGGQGGRSALFLIQTLVSGNSAFVAAEVLGPEVFNIPVNVTPHIVIADNFNLFGHDGLAGIVGFTPGPTDFVPNAPLAAVLNPTLGDNGGLTRTHALVAGSPAADAVPAASCATVSDQRGVLRPQDSDADTIADCDIGAFELQLSPAPPPPSPPLPDAAPADPNPQARCTRSRCDIRIRCNLDPASGVQCTDRIRFLVSERDVRLSEAASTKAARRIRFAAGFTNVQPGETRNVRLRLTKQGKEIVRTSRRKRIRGVMEIRNPGGATSTTRIRIRLR